jgi:hypothetical protein
MKKKNAQTIKPLDDAGDTIKKVEPAQVIDNNIKKIDSLDGVPEMWLEPATESIEESKIAEKEQPKTRPKKKEQMKEKPKVVNEPTIKPKKEGPRKDIKNTAVALERMVLIRSLACKKVKNNQPLYPGKRFPTDVGRVYCHSLLDNNSGKHNDIYHIWYMNGNLKAKVRIRVREGKEIPAFSDREINNDDRGTWKVEITDSDKKILDTVIFEVV